MREEPLDLLPELHRDVVLLGIGDIARDLAGIVVFFPGDLARVGVWAALGLGWAGLALTDFLLGSVPGRTFSARLSVRVRAVPAKLLQDVTLWAEILLVFRIPVKVCTRPCAIGPSGFIDDRNEKGNLSADEPSRHWCSAIGCVCVQAFWV